MRMHVVTFIHSVVALRKTNKQSKTNKKKNTNRKFPLVSESAGFFLSHSCSCGKSIYEGEVQIIIIKFSHKTVVTKLTLPLENVVHGL